MSWLLNKQPPEDKAIIQKRRDTLNHTDPEAEAAYHKKLKEQRIKNAEAAAIRDADNLANQKPFYQKVIGLGNAVLKDLTAASANINPDALINFNDDKPKPKKRKTKRRKKK